MTSGNMIQTRPYTSLSPPHHVSDTLSNVPVSRGSILGSQFAPWSPFWVSRWPMVAEADIRALPWSVLSAWFTGGGTCNVCTNHNLTSHLPPHVPSAWSGLSGGQVDLGIRNLSVIDLRLRQRLSEKKINLKDSSSIHIIGIKVGWRRWQKGRLFFTWLNIYTESFLKAT